jgi:V/A-type H+-transporting ATPase subunit E
MADDDSTQTTASGVQALIDRIRDDGVKAAKDEAARIVREAKEEAATIIAKAKKEAGESEHAASARIGAEDIAARESLKLAARDAIKDLGTRVRDAFERHLKRFVSAQLTDKEFMRKVILALAGEAAEDAIRDRSVEILLSEELGQEITSDKAEDVEAERRIRDFVLGISGESLREGIEFKLDPTVVADSVTVRIVGEDLQIDLNEDTVSGFLIRHLLPRYRRILEGQDNTEPPEE